MSERLTPEKLRDIKELMTEKYWSNIIDPDDISLLIREVERLWAERDFSEEDMEEAIGAAFAMGKELIQEMQATIESTEVRPTIVMGDSLSRSLDMVRCPRCRKVIEELHREGKVIRAGGVQVLSYVCPHCGKKIHWGVRV